MVVDLAVFVRHNTAIIAPPLVPEIRLHLASEMTPIWEATEKTLARSAVPPPFWAFAWVGGQALARYILDHPDQVAGRFTLIPAAAFTPGQEWATLIAAIEGALRLYRHNDGTLVALADYLHRRTRGLIGSLLWLIRDAAGQAILDGTERITRKALDAIAVDMTAQALQPRPGAAKR